MIKREMMDLLVNEYGYDRADLKDDKGNPFKNKKLESIIEEEEAKEEAVETDEEEQKENSANEFGIDETAFAPHHNFDDKDLILCMAGVKGEFNFVSPLSNFRAKTNGFGQTMKIPYGDLSYVHNIAPEAFEKGWIVVLNKQVQEEFGLTDTYKKVITPQNIRKVLKLSPNDLSEFIQDMPKGMKSALYDEARKQYQSGKIDSVKTINTIEDEFGVSLEDNAPTNDVINK